MSFNKYLTIFKISFQQEFAYRLNFIMWRVRNVLQIFLVYFLWDSVFRSPDRIVFGYDRSKILTYVFGILIVRAFVLSARAMDVAWEISKGDLSNYLLKPVKYFAYWLTRDISSKALNMGFAAIEFGILFLVLKPDFFFQVDLGILMVFGLSLIIASLIYFCLLFIVSSITFWAPELGWSAHFLVTVIIIEAASGALFPIDILPEVARNIIMATPFPYLIYFPVQVYLGKITGLGLIAGIGTSVFWLISLWFLLNFIWRKGLKAYQAYGR